MASSLTSALTEETPLLLLTRGPTEKASGDGIVNNSNNNNNKNESNNDINFLYNVYRFLNGEVDLQLSLFGTGYLSITYQTLLLSIIGIDISCFILGTMFILPVPTDQENNNSDTSAISSSLCYTGDICDMIFFGNYVNNGLQFLHIGSTCIVELLTVTLFTIEYIFRFMTAHYINPIKYNTIVHRILYYIPSMESIIDLLSIVPFYIDAFVLPNVDMNQSSMSIVLLLRMFRIVRMIRIDNNTNNSNNKSKINTALSLIDDVIIAQGDILITTTFVGTTVWIMISALYYICERHNPNMIYCPICYSDDSSSIDLNSTSETTDTFDPTTDCIIDSWGSVNCTSTVTGSNNTCLHCYHMYESIPMASYYTLLNLFGEYPLINQHSTYGKMVGTITAVVAVAVFAIPVGIIGNGLQTVITKRQQELQENSNSINSNNNNNDEETEPMTTTTTAAATTPTAAVYTTYIITPNFIGNNRTTRGKIYNIFHSRTYNHAMALELFINILILSTVIAFMIDTVTSDIRTHVLLDSFEFISVIVFTIEYIFRVYSITEDPKYQTHNCNRITYMCTFLPMVDLMSILPYWVEMLFLNGKIVSSTNNGSGEGGSSSFTRSLRLLRILRFERYTNAFTTFDDVIVQNIDVLAITAYTAIIFWVVFATLLYYTERNSLDSEIASNYNHIPNSMWITLLNLSGEAPLSQYSMIGKVITGFLGIFATGIFGIPIGVLGAGFEAIVTLENQDNVQELEKNESNTTPPLQTTMSSTETSSSNVIVLQSLLSGTTPLQQSNFVVHSIYNFVNGIGSVWAQYFELMIYIFILISVGVGVWQTVDEHTNDFHQLEWISVIIFTIEYILRLIGAGADPEFNKQLSTATKMSWSGSILCRLRFMISFYSVIDLLAIVPFYIAFALPNTFVNDYDEYFRMIRIVRLLKLDKYIPSISLIDDVIRLKFNTLRVAFYAAVTLWILFAAALFLCEHNDTINNIDPVPQYGCFDTNCTMSDRFQNFFDSMVYTGIHLTGDYPIITYSWPARVVNFFMVIAAVGVVAIPSGLIASGFVEVVRSKNKIRGETSDLIANDSDWYEVQYRSLSGVVAPTSPYGPLVDKWQTSVERFLNGKKENGQRTQYGLWSARFRIFMLSVIIMNIFAVLLESVPQIDRYIGNDPGNFFDVFEVFSVFVFATEYLLRLFSAPKSREALYSTWTYATTFFGIVDFLSTAPWFIERILLQTGYMDLTGDYVHIFRMFRIFRILQIEDFIVAFSKLDNVFRASKDVLKATGLLAFIVWIGCGALFFIFEENNPNWRSCDASVPLHSDDPNAPPGCYDFVSTKACNEYYPNMCSQDAFTNMPDALYYTAVFLGGEWGVVDFTWPGRIVCLFLCVVGIGLYSIPIGTLFDSFGEVLGLDSE